MAETLKSYRQDTLRITSIELADRAGCTQARISQIESGDLPRFLSARARFARAYGMSLHAFETLALAGAEQARSAARRGGGGRAGADTP